jgi:RES domain-containing protein
VLAYRIADSRRPVFDGTGAMLHGGRWNSPGRAVIYAADSYATAMLEVLAHANLSLVPKHHVSIAIDIPTSVKTETIALSEVEGWPQPTEVLCRRLGDDWLTTGRTAVLMVPSIVTAGHDRNLLINPAHRDFAKIRAQDPEPVRWDGRLFLAIR